MPVPSSITDLSTTAASNGPAGTDPISNTLDDYLRAIQAIMRSESLNKSWEAPGHTITWLSATQFTVPADLTATYRIGRRVKATLAGPTYAYSTITASSFAAGVTTVTVENDSAALTSPISAIELGPDILSLVEAGSSRLATRAWATAYIAALVASETQAGISELGTAAEYLTGTDPNRVLTLKTARDNNLVRSAATATTSGKFKDVTGIPAWAKRVTIVFNGVSLTGTDYLTVQLGDSGGIETSGYVSALSSGSTAVQDGTCFLAAGNSSGTSTEFMGAVTLFNVSGNTWVMTGVTGSNGISVQSVVNGRKTLSDTLTQLRVTTFVGTLDFDAGSFSVFWE